MSREIGTFNFAANFEVNKKSPLDAKQLVGLKSDLTDGTTWTGATGSAWLFNGAMVTVGSDPVDDNNGIYWLCDAANYTQEGSWKKVGEGAGVSNLTGATNGLCLFSTGTSVGLGGTLSENTTVNTTGFTCYWVAKGDSGHPFTDGIYYDNANAAFIGKDFGVDNSCWASAYYSSNGVQLDAGNSTGTTSSCLQLHWNGNACIQTTSGLTISSDGECSAKYAGDYSADYSCLSIPHVGWVTGQTGAISAANGLCRCDNDIILGGDLTGNTTISAASNDFNVTGASNINLCSTLFNVAYGDWAMLVGSNCNVSMSFQYSGNTACKSGIGFNEFFNAIQDDVHDCGISYLTDYSTLGKTCARWIPDWGAVTGYTQSAVTTSSNTVDVCNVNTTYTATTENDFIGVSGGSCIFLPASPKACQRITVVDISGDALLTNIDVNGNGTLINGCSNATINTEYGSITFINNNVLGWSAVAFIN